MQLEHSARRIELYIATIPMDTTVGLVPLNLAYRPL